MKITVASKNPQKVNAVKEIITDYPLLKDAVVLSVSVPSGVSEQPLSLDELIRGAINRAKAAFNDTDLSIGLESGFMNVPYTKTGMMDLCACAIYDGKEIHLGLSSAFEAPIKVAKLIKEKGMTFGEAVKEAELTAHPNVGYEEGAIGILTNGRLTRLSYTKQAVVTALIHLENSELYTK